MSTAPSSGSSTSNSATNSKFIFHQTEDVTSKYELGKVLGSGQFGCATVGTDKKTGARVAIKTIDKTRFRAADFQYQADAMKSEIEIMQSLNHPNIIKLLDVFETETALHLVMELCEGGELFDRYVGSFHFSFSKFLVSRLFP